MLPGYLHFDVRRGLTADMLNASMSSLLRNHDCVTKAFSSLGLSEITFTTADDAARGVKGHVVRIYANNKLLAADQKYELKLKPSAALPPSPIWDRKGHLENSDAFPKQACGIDRMANNEFLQACLNGDVIHLKQLRDVFLSKKVKASIQALALKILDNLASPIFVEQKLSGSDALWLLANLVTLCAQVDALDPKFITASKLCAGLNNAMGKRAATVLSIGDEVWLNQVLSTVPVIETENTVVMDVLAVAFLKTLAGHFGARGESTILQVGIGLGAHAGAGFVEALWCEASLPKSMNETGPGNHARVNSMHEISGKVSTTMDMVHLCATMSLHGAISISWHLVHGEKNLMNNHMRFFCSDEDKREVVEAFLIKGGAKDVAVRIVEHHELNRRLVSVPIGTGNKNTAIRFYEYIYYDKTVRVEPLKEDLDQYVQKTDYSVEVARGDLLTAWKKWRGRVAAEDA